MKAGNFLRENNARPVWHPIGHLGKLRKAAPAIISGGDGVHITDIDGHLRTRQSAGLGLIGVQPLKALL